MNSSDFQLRCAPDTHIVFPAMSAQQSAPYLAMFWQLEQMQWWPAERIRTLQFQQLDQLARYAFEHVGFHRERFKAAGIDPLSDAIEEYWPHLPPLTRSQVQDAGRKLVAEPPNTHGPLVRHMTSGSTGRPVTIFRTGLSMFMWNVHEIYTQLLHGRDVQGKWISISGESHKYGKEGHHSQTWGKPIDDIFLTGPTASLDIALDVDYQKQWLMKEEPTYLATHPSNLMSLLRAFERDGDTLPSLRGVQTLSETCPQELRDLCQHVFGVRLIDMYSAVEVGHIAVQAPEHDQYLVFAGNVMVDVVDDNGKPCAPGEIGRVLVTPLHTFASILLRYQIEDYAEVGTPCTTGRGLPTLSRVLGRRRNMLVLPDGSRHWPSFPAETWATIAPIRQLQLVQHAPDRIEARLVVKRPLSDEQARRLVAALQDRLMFPFPIELTCHESIPTAGARGKHEEFVSMVSPVPRRDA